MENSPQTATRLSPSQPLDALSTYEVLSFSVNVGSDPSPSGALNHLYYYHGNNNNPAAQPVYLMLINNSTTDNIGIPGNINSNGIDIFTVSFRPGVIDPNALNVATIKDAHWVSRVSTNSVGVVSVSLTYTGRTPITVGPGSSFQLLLCNLWATELSVDPDYNTRLNTEYNLDFNSYPASGNYLQVINVMGGTEGSGPCGSSVEGQAYEAPTSKPGCLTLPVQFIKKFKRTKDPS